METKGLIHLYVGDGKGKTTAAMGLAIRALGADKKILVVQFLKGQPTSELTILERLSIEVVRTDEIKKFTNQMNDEELQAAKENCQQCLEYAAKALADGSYGLVILDEVVDAVNCDLLESDKLISAITSRMGETEVVMTGRNPGDKIVELADYLTVMTALKHPYQHGVAGRRGIEY